MVRVVQTATHTVHGRIIFLVTLITGIINDHIGRVNFAICECTGFTFVLFVCTYTTEDGGFRGQRLNVVVVDFCNFTTYNELAICFRDALPNFVFFHVPHLQVGNTVHFVPSNGGVYTIVYFCPGQRQGVQHLGDGRLPRVFVRTIFDGIVLGYFTFRRTGVLVHGFRNWDTMYGVAVTILQVVRDF